MFQWLQTILQNLGFQVSDSPSTIYKDREPTIGIKQYTYLTSRVKLIVIPIHYVNKKYVSLTIDPIKLKTIIQP